MRRCSCSSHNGFLTAKGLALELESRTAQQTSLEGLSPSGVCDKVDIHGSVSGLRRDEIKVIWDDQLLNEQHRRFLNEFTDEVGSPDRSA